MNTDNKNTNRPGDSEHRRRQIPLSPRRRGKLAAACMILAILTAFPPAAISAQLSDPNTASQTSRTSRTGDSNTPNEIENTTPANPIAEPPSRILRTAGADIRREPNNKTANLGRLIWNDRITIPKDQNDSNIKEELNRIIRQIESLEFKTEEVIEPIVIVEPFPQIEPNFTAIELADQNQTQPEKTQIKPEPLEAVPGAISQETLKTLTDRLQHPEKIRNPLEMAEILFNNGNLKEAAICYRQALDRIDPNQPDSIEQTPWILFQLGNSLRNENPQQAREAYARLISEYAGSLWTDIAKARTRLITWYQQENPRTLIEQNKRPTVKQSTPPDYILTTKLQPAMEQSKGG
ncbi:MAG: tetratricopeptide repeat protein [Sedimentisphaerales bacterium]|nr:tetratricopeptide repeat protein [Sedimentisphaerales bacterium]